MTRKGDFVPFEKRFFPKIEPDPFGGCWLWGGPIFKRTGYAAIQWRRRSRLAHRISYEQIVGPVPDGLVLDHKCRVRSCVNPAHLEPVTQKENLDRGKVARGEMDSCRRGHEYTPANTRRRLSRGKYPSRQCKACAALRQRQYKAEKTAARRTRARQFTCEAI